jgi:hypothetical protein
MRTINDTPQVLRDLDFSIAQLRHAYTHLMAGRAARQEEFGRGLIAPEIRRLERVRSELVAQGTPAE